MQLSITSFVLHLVDRLPLSILLQPIDDVSVAIDERPNRAPSTAIVGTQEGSPLIARADIQNPSHASGQRGDDKQGVNGSSQAFAHGPRIVFNHAEQNHPWL